MAKEKLSKDAWLAAGFRSLAESGPAALQINLLAKELGATKGSFYWHFTDFPKFKAEMLGLWRTKVANEVIADISQKPTEREQLDALFANATRPAPDAYGGRKIEPAMRAWALSDPDVAAALDELDQLRLSFLRSLLDQLGVNGDTLSELVYGAYIGLDDLQSKGRVNSVKAHEALRNFILASLET